MKLLSGLVVAWAFLLALSTSDGARWAYEYLLLVYGGTALSAAWLIGTVAVLLDKPGRAKALRRPWIYAVPLLLVAALYALWLDVPFAVRFRVSRAALDQFVRELPRGTQWFELHDPPRVGLFAAIYVDTPGTSVRLMTGYCGVVNRCGSAYCPAGEPPVVGDDYYSPMGHGWWRWLWIS